MTVGGLVSYTPPSLVARWIFRGRSGRRSRSANFRLFLLLVFVPEFILRTGGVYLRSHLGNLISSSQCPWSFRWDWITLSDQFSCVTNLSLIRFGDRSWNVTECKRISLTFGKLWKLTTQISKRKVKDKIYNSVVAIKNNLDINSWIEVVYAKLNF